MIPRAARLARLPLERDLVINVTFVGDRKMADLNADFVGHEGTTDVISFCYLEGGEPVFDGDTAADLFICVDVAAREGGKRVNSSYARELTLYIVHGLLHCAGEDDLDSRSRKRMRRREREIMKILEKEFALGAIFP
ncbi:MAG: rRNA maturation RNase YbeY [Victivallaceae bacterium]|nr:rRNA maturation RNase YbeY [Victivallaceae bacterium]